MQDDSSFTVPERLEQIQRKIDRASEFLANAEDAIAELTAAMETRPPGSDQVEAIGHRLKWARVANDTIRRQSDSIGLYSLRIERAAQQ